MSNVNIWCLRLPICASQLILFCCVSLLFTAFQIFPQFVQKSEQSKECYVINYKIKVPTCLCFPMGRAEMKIYGLSLQKKNVRNNEMIMTYTWTAIQQISSQPYLEVSKKLISYHVKAALPDTKLCTEWELTVN